MTTHSTTHHVSTHNAHAASYLVMINGRPHIAHADIKPTQRAGTVLFYFWHNGRKTQASRTGNAAYFTA